MKVLWFVNIVMPEFALSKSMKKIPYGGWLHQLSSYLSKKSEVDLYIAFPFKSSSSVDTVGDIKYISFQAGKESECVPNIIGEINPDIVHIHGTEHLHSFYASQYCKNNSITSVVSIQGLVSIISQHIGHDLPFWVYFGVTPRNLIRGDSVYSLSKFYSKKGKYEVKTLLMSDYVIGRTDWDKAVTNIISPSIKYFHCNEVLRDSFYKNKWSLSECIKYRIFFSQAKSPLKGFHSLLKAVHLIKDRYPKITLHVAGVDNVNVNSVKKLVFSKFYDLYVTYLIRKFKLSDNVFFVGELDESDMVKEFQDSHIFVSASSIENESNSLSEAKLLGVPNIASYVGGVTGRVKHGVDGFLYQHDAPYMLAYYLSKIFDDDPLAINFSSESISSFSEINDVDKNLSSLLGIYKIITKGK